MKRIKLIVAYDGTNYCGWQIQPNGVTIEEVLNKELTRLLKEDIKVIGASRTDSGVHSLGNVAVFDTDTKIPAEKIAYALNVSLPEDIVIQESCEVESNFHPRFTNSIKTYEYRILSCTFPKPESRFTTHFYYGHLDIEKMRAAGRYLVGKHNFKSFCSPKTEVLDTVREIYALEVKKEEDIIKIRVSGNGFLYNMVRIIAGTLLEVGMGKYPPEKIPDILKKENRSAAGPTAPAKGLTMIGIKYIDN
ncbi:tRNA pseudouridine(38-40) synthase TruA [Anaerosacchariphilus polymeriproducens]|uniref:tRNA pseudouridine synthase A n=1 Tax=Anaerosacchariphilus polymeriproducens TaxID=1812858 RepID=A0A371AQA6_9FIRM|nr:tRNA pseudouridine(38-40) synthase TruA [Anaerosacchariphilus polymeriproducens]RDU21761.1 tRNA pseudouridine(38-40) synthase TruA [Anaerosacchariphilus polymeriproducens]